ncbi:MAG: hypothetical protein ACRD3S_10425, partial [Terracidiphilus sp.]
MRLLIAVTGLTLSLCIRTGAAQFASPPGLAVASVAADSAPQSPGDDVSSHSDFGAWANPFQLASSALEPSPRSQQTSSAQGTDRQTPIDAPGEPIPLERKQPQRILGFMPNFRSVSAGSKPHPPGWKYNFKVATRQATDYSSFIFLGLTSLTAEGMNEHPSLGKGVGGFYAYTWRGFLDKSDGTYLSAWLLSSALHEDTRFYALGNERSIPIRALYVISRQGVARTYGGRQTPNIAGLGAKVLTQVVSRNYYPTSATTFPV